MGKEGEANSNVELESILGKGTKIFNPQAKVIANVDSVIEFLETGNAAPILVEVDPSNACNHGCYFCLSGHIHLEESKGLETFNRLVMPRDILMRTCKDFVEMNVRAINWTGGGEPTINPALKEAIQYIGENSDIKMGMFTNGTLLDKWDLFDTLVNYMTWVRFSVDAGTPETFNSVRRVKPGQDWDRMNSNLERLIRVNNDKGRKIDIGAGFVITPDTYHEIVDFAKHFVNYEVDYCQYKPEIVNREREDGKQRDADFWNEQVMPLLREARGILGDKFQINGYKVTDLQEDPSLYGRTYKRCLGSQLQPCVGADGNVYVCTNHRGYKEYSYGTLHEKSFKDIWNDIEKRQAVMHQIDNVECFANCTQLCKPHESNKMMWEIHQKYNSLSGEEREAYKNGLLEMQSAMRKKLVHPEFI